MFRKIDVEQGSFEWHLLRQGVVTGTTLKSALGSPKVQETLLYKLVAERMTEVQIDGLNSPQIARGRESEPLAIKAVMQHTGLEFAATGMLENTAIEGFRLSPDGIYERGVTIAGGVEVKCPDSKKHVEYLLNDEIPKEYLDQVKAPFVLSDEIEFWYFASFDDRNYQAPLFIKKATRADFPSIEADRRKLAQFVQLVNEKHLALTF